MAGKIIYVFILLNGFTVNVWSQACTTIGQTPVTAFPVCGTSVFTQTSVPQCSGTVMPTPCTGDRVTYKDVNPYWYKFTCYSTGTLGFQITPKNLGDDYDWQLFDITGRNPADVYTDNSLIVSANWSGSPGITGASPAGKNPFECASDPSKGVSTFSTMPKILEGHDYLLMISHYDGATQSGYTLTYPTGQDGGTASIVNPLVPAVTNAHAVCDGTEIVMKLNKKINCNSLATDGSDFSLSGPIAVSIVSATGNGCNNGFDSDSILLKLNRVLAPGSYTVNAKNGTDGNTLVDNCSNSLPPGAIASLKFTAAQPTPMDSISPVICIKDSLQLIFSKPIDCSSIASDGSDFLITGPSTVTVKSAKGVCTNGVSSVINIFLLSPIRMNGMFTITLKNGSDGNPLIDECGQITPAGSTLLFTTKNITVADFSATVAAGCKKDTLFLSHNGNGAANLWQWKIDSIAVSFIQNPVIISKAFGSHITRLTVSNGKCTDSVSSKFIFPDQTVRAAFAVSDTLCPTDSLHFTDMSSTNATSWKWNFGNGSGSISQTPSGQYYPLTGRPANYTSSLTVQNNFNCTDIAYKIITVLASCYIAVPSAFTPNGDGLNDYLYPLNAFKTDNFLFSVFNRYGQIIFKTTDYTKKWDGRINGVLQGSGTYVWMLSYTERDTRQKVVLSGTTVLIR